jgi:uncharacterized protein (DUF433 family)/DNA-binding transcriptional MerR regulator
LAGVSGDRIGQWARRGYIRSSVSDAAPRIYSYQDAGEAMAVHELKRRHVGLAQIKSAIEELRERFGDWPLSSAPLVVPSAGGAIAEMVDDDIAVTVSRRRRGQALLDLNDLEAIRTQLHRGGWATREHPDLRHIQVDPDLLSGRPTIRGHRIAAEDVAATALRGGRDQLRRDFALTTAEIDDAVRWWNAVRRYEAA